MSFMDFKITPLRALFSGQFLSALVDNMILFITLAILNRDAYPSYYLPLVQASFLISYIVLTPWVGRFADKNPKSRVLMVGNSVKLIGVSLLVFNQNPALCYSIVGIGAVIYSPAKYGILPSLTSTEQELLSANANVEGYTIAAILVGSTAGGLLAEQSISLALLCCIALYAVSIAFNAFLPAYPGDSSITYRRAMPSLLHDFVALWQKPQSRFSLLGTASFWMSTIVLRLAVIAWLPLALGIASTAHISYVIGVTGIGIVTGAAMTPRFIALDNYPRAAQFGLAMAICIMAFSFVGSIALAVAFLLIVGFFGGVFIVPLNACLQHVGKQTVGTGRAVAIQNFMENTAMFISVAAYTYATSLDVLPGTAITVTGGILLLIVLYLMQSSIVEPQH